MTTLKGTNPFNWTKAAGRYFVGREHEVGIFLSLLADLEAGSPRHLFASGEPGTGKTSFLEHCRELAHNDGFLARRIDLNPGLPRDQLLTILRAPIDELVENHSAIEHSALSLQEDVNTDQRARKLHFPRHSVADSNALRHDFQYISDLVRDSYRLKGIVICIDEAQYFEKSALPKLKNAVMPEAVAVLVVLATGLVTRSPTIGDAGRQKLAEMVSQDQGTERMFGKLVTMGPFRDDDEAFRCMSRRLHEAPISFSDEVVHDICGLSMRIPRELMILASDTYDIAIDREKVLAEAAELAQAYAQSRGPQLNAIRSFVDDLSPDSHRILDAFLRSRGPCNVGTIVQALQREAAAERSGVRLPEPQLTEWVTSELQQYVQRADWLQPLENGYFTIPDFETAYRLRVALKQSA